MPSSTYHHGHLREALVSEAVEIVREQGPDALVVRALARRLGVSHNAAYRHFAHRDDLVAAVAGRAHAELMTAMEHELSTASSRDATARARRRLASIGRAYVTFATTEPGLFRLAFTPQAAGLGAPTSSGPYRLLTEALDELVAVGFLAPDARPGAEITCWSAVHGFAMLSLEGPLAVLDASERITAVDQVLVAIDRSYAATTGSDADPASIVMSP